MRIRTPLRRIFLSMAKENIAELLIKYISFSISFPSFLLLVKVNSRHRTRTPSHSLEAIVFSILFFTSAAISTDFIASYSS